MLDLSIIYLSDLKKQLPFKDSRSLKSFLSKLKVEIFRGNSDKRPYVFKLQFERAQLEEKINSLIERFGDDWINVIQSEMKIYSQYKAILEEKQFRQEMPVVPKQDKILGVYATKFLKDIHREDLHDS